MKWKRRRHRANPATVSTAFRHLGPFPPVATCVLDRARARRARRAFRSACSARLVSRTRFFISVPPLLVVDEPLTRPPRGCRLLRDGTTPPGRQAECSRVPALPSAFSFGKDAARIRRPSTHVKRGPSTHHKCPWLCAKLASVPKPPKAVSAWMRQLGLKGGAKGGRTRAQHLTPEQRRESAQKAARARWAKKKAR